MANLLIVLLLALVILLGLILLEVQRIAGAVAQNTAELRELRLKSRARISTASIGTSGEAPVERELRRLGRSSRAKRVVVGGDSDSEMNQALARGLYSEEADDE